MPNVTVTQAAKDAAARLMGKWDDGDIHCDDFVEAFARFEADVLARHRADAEPVACAGCEGRPAAENNPCAVCGLYTHPAEPAQAVEALREARRIIADIDDYMKRPSRGDWGEECACCMGELLDDDRDAIARIDAALAAMGEHP